MTAEDFIIDLFCRVDDRMKNVPNHSQAALWLGLGHRERPRHWVPSVGRGVQRPVGA